MRYPTQTYPDLLPNRFGRVSPTENRNRFGPIGYTRDNAEKAKVTCPSQFASVRTHRAGPAGRPGESREAVAKGEAKHRSCRAIRFTWARPVVQRLSERSSTAAMIRSRLALTTVFVALVMALPPYSASPVFAQYACTTNYCVKSHSLSYDTPPEWPAIPIAPCCRTDWGSLPGEIDWSNGVPVMICTGGPDYVTDFPNCGAPNNPSLAYPLNYRKPRFAIGVAWPNAKNYRYQMESVPILDGPDGSCARYSSQPGKVANWWVHEITGSKQGSYVFSAAVSFQRGEQGYYAVLNGCKLVPPS